MFLSDELIEIGMTANPKNNRDMGECSIKMHELLQQRCNGNVVTKQVYNIVVLVCDTLNKKGWKYYKPDLFFVAR